MKRHRKRKTYSHSLSKTLLLGASLLVFGLCILSGTTLAYLSTGTTSISLPFLLGQISCQVENEIEAEVPQRVTVKNTGTAPAYIRASLVVNWVSETDETVILANAPQEGVDYIIVYAADEGWKKASDGFWYFTDPVAAKASTGTFIETCMRTKTAEPEGYYLSVEVTASAIQSEPGEVAAENWKSGVKELSGATLIIKEEVTEP